MPHSNTMCVHQSCKDFQACELPDQKVHAELELMIMKKPQKYSLFIVSQEQQLTAPGRFSCSSWRGHSKQLVPFLPADIIPPIQRQQNQSRVLSSTTEVQTGVTSVAINFHISTLGCELQQLRSEQTHPWRSPLCSRCGRRVWWTSGEGNSWNCLGWINKVHMKSKWSVFPRSQVPVLHYSCCLGLTFLCFRSFSLPIRCFVILGCNKNIYRTSRKNFYLQNSKGWQITQ